MTVNFHDNGIQIGVEVEENDIFDVSKYRRFHCYSRLDKETSVIINKDPLAVFYHINSNSFYICFWKKKQQN